MFPLITDSITDSEFEQALKIIIDNNNVRPTGDAERTAYCGFLTSHLEKTSKPNVVLQTLKNSFGYFSEMKNLAVSALNNSATDRSLLVDVIAKCFNNYKDVDKVSSEALPMFSNTQVYTVLQEV